jgi:hypothetical protein
VIRFQRQHDLERRFRFRFIVPEYGNGGMVMTRTAVRRRVDLTDGRLVIRKIVVETSECRAPGPAVEPAAAELPQAEGRGRRLRVLRPGTYAVRSRETHLI